MTVNICDILKVCILQFQTITHAGNFTVLYWNIHVLAYSRRYMYEKKTIINAKQTYTAITRAIQ